MLMFYTAMIEDSADVMTFEYIYAHYRRQMLCVAKQILPTHEDAEDAVQNALLKLAKGIKQVPVEDTRRQKAYVLTAARNAAVSILEQVKRKEEHEQLYGDLDNMADPKATLLLEALVQSQDAELISRLLSQLPLEYREVLLLRYVEHLPYQRIAQLLGRKEGTVRQQFARAKAQLAKLYQQEVAK